MTSIDSPSFTGATELRSLGDGHFAAELHAGWSSLVGIHGGYTASIAAKAILATIDDDTRPLRSLATQFVSPPRPGPASVLVSLERTGRSATFATAKVVQNERLRLLLTAVAGSGRPGAEYDDRRSPATPLPPPGLTRIAPPPEALDADRVSHFDNAELILDPATTPFSAGPTARLAGWIRPLAGDRVTAPWLVCACDFFPPAVFARLASPVAAATVDYSVHLLVSDFATHVAPGDYVYAEMQSSHSAEGYAVENGIVWAPDGTTLATSRQLRLAGA